MKDDSLPLYRFKFGGGVGESPKNPFKPKRFRDIKTGWNLVTPEICAEGASRTQHASKTVRSVRHFQMIVNDLTEGRWDENGESIVISETGMVNDGTHRMAAGWASGVSFVAYFVCGVPDSLALTYGKAKPLPPKDILGAYHQIKNANLAAATASVALGYKNRLLMSRGKMTSRETLVECAKGLSDLVNKYIMASRAPMFRGRIGCSWVAAFLAIADMIDTPKAEEIAEMFENRALFPGTALHSFAARLDNLSAPAGTPDNATRAAMLVNAMNAHREGVSKKIIAPKEGTLGSKTFPVLWGVEPEDLPF